MACKVVAEIGIANMMLEGRGILTDPMGRDKERKMRVGLN
jgi:hypothetical protein